MATTPVTNTNTNTNTTSTPQKTQLSANYQDFLKLLTTQLQNQDPTAPADTNEITQQIASLSQVEQQINTNKNLEQLISLFSANHNNNAVGYIGKQVDVAGNTGRLAGGTAIFAYSLPEAADSVSVEITNQQGQKVFSGDGTKVAGRNQVYWDGTNSISGETMADGVYTIKVTAKKANGDALTATTYSTGIVTSVETANGTTSLSIGSQSVPLTDVISVRNVS